MLLKEFEKILRPLYAEVTKANCVIYGSNHGCQLRTLLPMIQVLHISAECYPAAKSGGLGDVVGSLPKYQTQAGIMAAAIIPKYAVKWINHQEWEGVWGGTVRVDWRNVGYHVMQLKNNNLGYPLFVVDIPGLFDRPGIYADPHSGAPYRDETERYIVFQQAVLQWLLTFPEAERPQVLHCHDHHTGLIPFLVKHSPLYRGLAKTPTVFTIHNGQYQGMFSWSSLHLMPFFDAHARGYLEWNGVVNPMAAALRCAWAVTTVSESYLFELHEKSMGLEQLFRDEWRKETGIVNGIDADVWDPRTDPMVQHKLEGEKVEAFKKANKKVLCEWFGLSPDKPLVSFIGRMVGEKGVDILPDAYKRFLHAGAEVSFLVLGTGEKWTQDEFRSMAHQYQGRFNAVIDYNEALSHQIYAGSDYLIMPSRVEPCGLNQMYAMRYGTIPIVRSVGGLKDTVPDIGEAGGHGRGIRFDHFSIEDVVHAIYRGVSLWHSEPGILAHLRRRVMAVDFSWEHVIQTYQNVYNRIGARVAPFAPGKAVEVPAAKETSAQEEHNEMVVYKSSLPAMVPEKKAVMENAPVAAKEKAPAAKKAVVKKAAAPAPIKEDKPTAKKAAKEKSEKTPKASKKV